MDSRSWRRPCPRGRIQLNGGSLLDSLVERGSPAEGVNAGCLVDTLRKQVNGASVGRRTHLPPVLRDVRKRAPQRRQLVEWLDALASTRPGEHLAEGFDWTKTVLNSPASNRSTEYCPLLDSPVNNSSPFQTWTPENNRLALRRARRPTANRYGQERWSPWDKRDAAPRGVRSPFFTATRSTARSGGLPRVSSRKGWPRSLQARRIKRGRRGKSARYLLDAQSPDLQGVGAGDCIFRPSGPHC